MANNDYWLKLVRMAFSHGYWAWADPANENELQEVIKGEEEAWTQWAAEHAELLFPENRVS